MNAPFCGEKVLVKARWKCTFYYFSSLQFALILLTIHFESHVVACLISICNTRVSVTHREMESTENRISNINIVILDTVCDNLLVTAKENITNKQQVVPLRWSNTKNHHFSIFSKCTRIRSLAVTERDVKILRGNIQWRISKILLKLFR